MLRRINKDINSLKKEDLNIFIPESDIKKIIVDFKGPKDTIYETGVWKIKIEFPVEYPLKSPCVNFETPIYHPNVEPKSGAICLDVLTTEWTPMYEIKHIFDTFLPQLLSYPNPDDPFNTVAAAELKNNKAKFEKNVIEYINKYCNKDGNSEKIFV